MHLHSILLYRKGIEMFLFEDDNCGHLNSSLRHFLTKIRRALYRFEWFLRRIVVGRLRWVEWENGGRAGFRRREWWWWGGWFIPLHLHNHDHEGNNNANCRDDHVPEISQNVRGGSNLRNTGNVFTHFWKSEEQCRVNSWNVRWNLLLLDQNINKNCH